jgi:hypothetical protein
MRTHDRRHPLRAYQLPTVASNWRETESGMQPGSCRHLDDSAMIVMASTPCRRGNVCALGALSHLLKITSARSRHLLSAADTATVPHRGTPARKGKSGRRRTAASFSSSQGLARRPSMQERFELRVPTQAALLRPPAATHRNRFFPDRRTREPSIERSTRSKKRRRCSDRGVRQYGMRCRPQFVAKETLVNEMEHDFRSARCERWPVYPELWLRAPGSHAGLRLRRRRMWRLQ